MKRYMMSDIHGFLEAFEAALKKTDLSGKNQLILLGDYIDYGPDGRAVLEKVRALQEKYGSEKIILGADARKEKIAISGWLEESKEEVIPFIQNYQKEGIQYVICTDISKDGMLEGPSFELYQRILDSDLSNRAESRLKLIASGGISTFDELPKLAELGCEGTIIGKAIYEGRITLKQLENYIIKK